MAMVAIKRVMPILRSDQPTACRDLYEDVLGLDLAMDLGWIVTFVAPDNPAAQISLMAEDETAPVRPHVSIEVDDVDAVYDEAVRRGYEIVHPLTNESWGVRRFFVRDPSGNVLNVLTHAPT